MKFDWIDALNLVAVIACGYAAFISNGWVRYLNGFLSLFNLVMLFIPNKEVKTNEKRKD